MPQINTVWTCFWCKKLNLPAFDCLWCYDLRKQNDKAYNSVVNDINEYHRT